MKFTKFLLTGMFCLSASLNAIGQDTSLESYNDIINKKFHDEALSIIEKYSPENIQDKNLTLNIKLLPSLATLEKKLFGQKFNSSPDLSFFSEKGAKYSYFTVKNNDCSIQLAIDDDGTLPTLSPGDGVELLSVTNLKNDTQRRMAREFLALHENYHCTFSSIQNPIKVNNNLELSNKVNYLLQDQVQISSIPYIKLLNENFADTAAALSLIKEYGANNKDLQFVIQSWTSQRHASYFQNYFGEHATHFSLKKIYNQKIDKEIKNFNQEQIIQKSLEIANDGTIQVFQHKKYMLENAFNLQNITKSINYKVYKALLDKYMSFERDRNSNKESGFSSDVAYNIVKNFDISSLELYTNDGKPGKDFDFLDKTVKILINNYQLTESESQIISQATENLQQFNLQFVKNESPFDYIVTKPNSNDIYRKLNIIRDEFLKKQKKLNL